MRIPLRGRSFCHLAYLSRRRCCGDSGTDHPAHPFPSFSIFRIQFPAPRYSNRVVCLKAVLRRHDGHATDPPLGDRSKAVRTWSTQEKKPFSWSLFLNFLNPRPEPVVYDMDSSLADQVVEIFPALTPLSWFLNEMEIPRLPSGAMGLFQSVKHSRRKFGKLPQASITSYWKMCISNRLITAIRLRISVIRVMSSGHKSYESVEKETTYHPSPITHHSDIEQKEIPILLLYVGILEGISGH